MARWELGTKRVAEEEEVAGFCRRTISDTVKALVSEESSEELVLEALVEAEVGSEEMVIWMLMMLRENGAFTRMEEMMALLREARDPHTIISIDRMHQIASINTIICTMVNFVATV